MSLESEANETRRQIVRGLGLGEMAVEVIAPSAPPAEETCHCDRPIHTDTNGFTRGMCQDCTSLRCDLERCCLDATTPPVEEP